ncbi:hypothetical protein IFR04_009901 [Cadophora malorum]|uniref:Uncharacterized protein n=1 Tax=Cadophora malorum TaxID=108018 RepID=A0A8H7TD32_9HELO|nr:hypothetical protein IFR04_009901 [Cadophora malorum]
MSAHLAFLNLPKVNIDAGTETASGVEHEKKVRKLILTVYKASQPVGGRSARIVESKRWNGGVCGPGKNGCDGSLLTFSEEISG